MLSVVVRLQTEQQTPREYTVKRDKKYVIHFAQSYEVVSSWQNMTDTAKLKLPKNVVIRDKNKRTFNLRDSNKPLGASMDEIPPVFMKGDKITIDHGYWGQTPAGGEKLYMTGEGGIPHLFQGYITGVKSGDLFELTCEDNMWKLKQTGTPKKSWQGVAIEDMLKELLAGTGFNLPPARTDRKTVLEVAKSLKMKLGAYITDGQDVAKVLEELRSKHSLEAYFRGEELRVGLPVYHEEDARMHHFVFSGEKGNIISHSLEFKNKEEEVLSAVARTLVESSAATNHRGKPIKRTAKKEYLITLLNRKFTVTEIEPGEQVPENKEGQRRTFDFTANTPKEQMIAVAKEGLQRYCYEGFSGHFTTFGMPFVRHGDHVKLTDPNQPERDGTYKVKAVTYKGGTSGLRQEIHLDYKIPRTS
jgi:hypothetical protein